MATRGEVQDDRSEGRECGGQAACDEQEQDRSRRRGQRPIAGQDEEEGAVAVGVRKRLVRFAAPAVPLGKSQRGDRYRLAR